MYLQLSVMPGPRTGGHHIQVFDVLEAVAQIAQKGVVEVLEHAPLADDVFAKVEALPQISQAKRLSF